MMTRRSKPELWNAMKHHADKATQASKAMNSHMHDAHWSKSKGMADIHTSAVEPLRRKLKLHLKARDTAARMKGGKNPYTEQVDQVYRSDDTMPATQPKETRKYHTNTRGGRWGERRATSLVRSGQPLRRGRSKPSLVATPTVGESELLEARGSHGKTKSTGHTNKGWGNVGIGGKVGRQNKGWTSDPEIAKSIKDMYGKGHTHAEIHAHLTKNHEGFNKGLKDVSNRIIAMQKRGELEKRGRAGGGPKPKPKVETPKPQPSPKQEVKVTGVPTKPVRKAAWGPGTLAKPQRERSDREKKISILKKLGSENKAKPTIKPFDPKYFKESVTIATRFNLDDWK